MPIPPGTIKGNSGIAKSGAGFVNLSDYDDFAAAVAAAPDGGVVLINRDETLAADVTIPSGKTVASAGGKLTIPSANRVTVNGKTSGAVFAHQDASDPGNIRYQGGVAESLSLVHNSSSDASENRDRLQLFMQSVGGTGAGYLGTQLQLGGGLFWTDAFTTDDLVVGQGSATALTKFHNIVGHGSRKSVLKLSDSQADGFDFDDLFNGSMRHMGFEGNSANQSWATDTALLTVSSYNSHYENLNVRDSDGIGIRVNSSQQYTFVHCEAELCDEAGWSIENAWSVTMIGCGSEQNAIGVHITGTDDTRKRTIGTTIIGGYFEATSEGVVFGDGISGAYVLGGVYHTGTDAIVFRAGASGNYADAGSIATNIDFEAGSHHNEVRPTAEVKGGTSFTGDLDCNAVVPIAVKSLAWDPRCGVDGDSIVDDTNPIQSSASGTVVSGTARGLDPCGEWAGNTHGTAHAKITRGDVTTWGSKNLVVTSAPAGKHYLYLVSMTERGNAAFPHVRMRNNSAGNLYWNAKTDAFDLASGGYFAVPHIAGELTFSRVPFTIPSGSPSLQIEFGLIYSANASLHWYHWDISSEPNKTIEYVRNGTSLGTMHTGVQFATSGRPNADAVTLRSQFYDTTLNKMVITDGTNWRDFSGATV